MSKLIVLSEEDYEDLTEEQKANWSGYTYRMTYETWDEESLEIGETDDKGWEVEDGGKCEYLEDILRTVSGDANWLEWSSSHPKGQRCNLWINSEGYTDCHTGKITNHSLFIERLDKEPLSDKEIECISEKLRIRC